MNNWASLVALIVLLSIDSTFTLTTKSKIGADAQVGRMLTMDVQGKLTCFYEPLEAGMQLSLSMRPAISSRFPMQFRATSPTGSFSEWINGDGLAKLDHNTTETGDYELCLYAPRPVRVHFFIHFYNPQQVEDSLRNFLSANNFNVGIQKLVTNLIHRVYSIYYSIKYYNQVSVRDESLQNTNGDYIRNYSILFCTLTVTIAVTQVVLVRRMFNIDVKRIRI